MTTYDPDQAVRGEEFVDSRTRLLLDRRNMLRVGGLVAVTAGGVALAACSPAQPTTTPSSAAPSSEAPSSSAPSSAAPSSASSAPSSAASSSAPAPSGPSVAASSVPVGSGVIDANAKIVVTQPTKGQFKAFTAVCTHQGCLVSEMKADKIVCTCHQSEFSITDGSVQGGPAKAPLEEYKTTVSGSNVVVDA